MEIKRLKYITLIILAMFMAGCTTYKLTNYSEDDTKWAAEIAERRRQHKEERAVELAEKAKKRAERPERIRSKNWSSRITDAVINNKIILGMTKEQVLASWGRPNDINRSIGSWGVHEQWIYKGKYYLYFEDGVLTSFQD